MFVDFSLLGTGISIAGVLGYFGLFTTIIGWAVSQCWRR